MDNKKIIPSVFININQIDDSNFFRSLINKCYENSIISDNIMDKIGYDRMKMLQEVLVYYTKNESSSVLKEDAESILENVDYIIGVYLREERTIENVIEKLSSETIQHMFQEGRKIIKEKFIKCKEQLEYIQKNKIKCKIFSYDDTIDYGLSIFFKCYDDLFKTHETPGSIDYQLFFDVGNYSGIIYMEKYLNNLNIENKFCSYFSSDNIVSLLKGYDKKYELLLINVFELVLINAVGLTLLNKFPYELNITDSERKTLEEKLAGLSEDDVKEKVNTSVKKLIEMLNIMENDLIEYIFNAVDKISALIYKNLEIKTLSHVFISFKEYEEKIKYIDKERMSNKKFRRITEQIRNCADLKQKINIIDNNITSLTDLNDMLCAECLFGMEFKEYFKTLTGMHLALLCKYVEEFNEQYEWIDYLYEIIENLNEEDKININSIKNKIEIYY